MARPFPWECRSCGKRQLVPAVVDYPVGMEHDGRAYQFTVPRLDILECRDCRERVLPDEALARVTGELREQAGLLPPDEIRRKRVALGLTRGRLAELIGVAEATLSRWERGGQIPSRHSDLILRAFFDVPEFRHYLERRTA